MPNKMMKDLRGLDEKGRAKQLEELRLELIKARAQAAKSGSAKIQALKKRIARIKTIEREHTLNTSKKGGLSKA